MSRGAHGSWCGAGLGIQDVKDSLLTVIVVNYRSAMLTCRAVESVIADSQEIATEIIVVDNSELTSENALLRAKLPSSVRVITNDTNEGFGLACNRAYQDAAGEFILLLNPDAYLLPGALNALIGHFGRETRCGAVAPVVYWDEGCHFVLPPMPMPSPWHCARDVVLQSSRWLSSLFQMSWRWYARRLLKAESPVRQRNLSGGVVILRKKALEAAGGLFDSRFFMYFEDADLFGRLRAAGYILRIEPRARAVHNYNQTGRDDLASKYRYFLEARYQYFEKYDRLKLARLLCWALDGLLPKGHEEGVEHLGKLDSPPTFSVPPQIASDWILECSPNRNLVPAAIWRGQGSKAAFPLEAWRLLTPGKHFARLGGGRKFYTEKTWSWEIHSDQFRVHA